MSQAGTGLWLTLEEGRAKAFLLAGALWVIDTVLLGIELLAGVSIFGTPGPLNPVLYISGTVAACVGLLGFYPSLAEQARSATRISAGIVGIAGAALAVVLVWFVITTVLNQPDPPAALLILSILGVTLGIVCFGILGVWTGIPSRVVGVLLLGIVATLIGGLVLVYVVYGGDSPEWTSPAIGVGVSTCLLLLGVLLRSDGSTRGGEETTHVVSGR